MTEAVYRSVYDNGLPWTTGRRKDSEVDKLKFCLDKLQARVHNGKATLIIVDGGLGEGKTTMGVHLASYFIGNSFSFDDVLYMGGEKFLKGIKVCFENNLPVILYDESGDFDKRGSMSKLNKTLGRIFDIYRAFRIIVILILPSFFALDNSLFDKNIPRLLINCHGRTKRQGNFRAYSLYRMHWLRERAKKCVVKSDAFRLVQPNFRGHFLNLSVARSKELDKYSTKGKLDVVDLVTIKQEGLVSYDEIALRSGLTKDTVQRKISKLGIKPSKIYKGKNYFSEEVIKHLKVRT